MGIRIEQDQLGNLYAKGGTAGGNFLNAIGILCFIIGGIGLIGVFGGATSLIGIGTISGILGTIFIYGGSHINKKAQQKKLEEYMLGLQQQQQSQQLEFQKQQEIVRQQQLEREEKLKVEAQKKQTFESKESIADELLKLANLREKGILSEEEFLKMKQDLINKAGH